MEWAKAYGEIVYKKLIGLLGHLHGKPKKASAKTLTISKLSSKWHTDSMDLFGYHLCGPMG